jgi:methionyl-tRNA synthetase
VGSLGNFCYRVLTFAQKNYGNVQNVAEEKELSAEVLSLLNEIQRYYLALDFKSAVRLILQVADKGNAYFQKSEVWKQKDTDFARQVLGWCVNLARNLAIIVQPILPAFSLKIERALGGKVLSLKDIGFSWIGKISLVEMLVAKIEDAVQVTFPLRLMVGHVKEVRDHPNADSLYVLQVDFGDAVSRRQVVAGLKKHFSKEELIGKKAVFCVNMKAAKLRGEMSEAMILVAEELDESHLSLLSIDAGLTKGDVVDNAYDVAVGDEVQFEGMNFAGKEVTYDDFKKILMKVLDGGIVYEEKKLMCKGRKVVVIGVKDGGIVR